jgi:hypothetical protein
MFPNDVRPRAKAYEKLLKELGSKAVYLPLSFDPAPPRRTHVDPPDNYEAELAALGLGPNDKDVFEDDDDDGLFDDAANKKDELWELGPPAPKGKKVVAKKKTAARKPSRRR